MLTRTGPKPGGESALTRPSTTRSDPTGLRTSGPRVECWGQYHLGDSTAEAGRMLATLTDQERECLEERSLYHIP